MKKIIEQREKHLPILHTALSLLEFATTAKYPLLTNAKLRQ